MNASAPDTQLAVPQGQFTLLRFPERPKETLRAWDAADEYLLNFIGTELADYVADWDPAAQTTVVVNDSFGALGTALAAFKPVSWSDSSIAHGGLAANMARNGVHPGAVTPLPSVEAPPERIDLLVVKVPKSHGQLEDQLRRLHPSLHPDTIIVAGGMVKQIHTNTLEIFESALGPTHTSLAVKKARLIFTDLDPELDAAPADGPTIWNHHGKSVINHPGVFSSAKLDIGTRCLLGAMPDTEDATRIVDLGCGNGIVGLMAATANPDAELIFIDESYGAVASAEATFRASFPDRDAQFIVAHDATAVVPAGSVDLVLNNPPFHQNQALGDVVAWDMFQAAKTMLTQGGEAWIVGNRHLKYHLKVQRVFGNCETQTGNPKFVVLRAVRD